MPIVPCVKIVLAVLVGLSLAFPNMLLPEDELLEISMVTKVAKRGSVEISLVLENRSREPLYNVRPALHFHHSMFKMPTIPRMYPGERRALVNTEHPPVVRVGRYPLAAMVRYQKSRTASDFLVKVHTDSFYFREPLVSEVGGKIESAADGNRSLLQIALKNESSSFKNLQLMLLLPPGLVLDRPKGGIGLTLYGGEEKYFEIPIKRLPGVPGGEYPVHLTIEYGEVQKHYTGEIRGNVKFPMRWGDVSLWNHLALAGFLSFMAFLFYRRKAAVTKGAA
ncbi:MAG: hypothetical protein ACE5GQ_06530 [Nitrospinales bacterium]